MKRSFEGKNVLITGTNRGLGKIMVEEFASQGANILAHTRECTTEFLSLMSTLESKHMTNITPLFFDMTDYKSMKKTLLDMRKKEVSVDVLINSAGVSHGGFLQATSLTKIKEVFEINFFSVIALTQLVVKLMIANHNNGAVVNIASIAGIDLDVGNCAYGMSKAGIISLTKLMAKEYTPLGIRVNAIAPGLLDTNMAGQMESKAKEKMLSRSLMKRLGRPEEIAYVASFLASDKASFVSGQVIRVDGGEM